MSEIESTRTETLKLTYEHLTLEEATKLVDYWAKSRYDDRFFDKNIDHECIPCTFLMCDDIGEGTDYGEDYTVVFGPLETKYIPYKDKDCLTTRRSWVASSHIRELNILRKLIKEDLNID